MMASEIETSASKESRWRARTDDQRGDYAIFIAVIASALLLFGGIAYDAPRLTAARQDALHAANEAARVAAATVASGGNARSSARSRRGTDVQNPTHLRARHPCGLHRLRWQSGAGDSAKRLHLPLSTGTRTAPGSLSRPWVQPRPIWYFPATSRARCTTSVSAPSPSPVLPGAGRDRLARTNTQLASINTTGPHIARAKPMSTKIVWRKCLASAK